MVQYTQYTAWTTMTKTNYRTVRQGQSHTDTEKILSKALTQEGIAHLTKPLLHGYYPDLLIPSHKLVIEVDGSIHNKESVRRKDIARSSYLRSKGYTVLRFSNSAVRFSLPGVIARIKRELIIYLV